MLAGGDIGATLNPKPCRDIRGLGLIPCGMQTPKKLPVERRKAGLGFNVTVALITPPPRTCFAIWAYGRGGGNNGNNKPTGGWVGTK